MTGAELRLVRNLLNVDQASIAASLGWNTVSNVQITAADVATAEGQNGNITNSGVNVACDKFLRPHLLMAGYK